MSEHLCMGCSGTEAAGKTDLGAHPQWWQVSLLPSGSHLDTCRSPGLFSLVSSLCTP